MVGIGALVGGSFIFGTYFIYQSFARAANHTAHSVHPNYLVALSTVQQSMSEILYFILVVFPGLVPLMQLMALVSFAFVVATHIAVGQKL